MKVMHLSDLHLGRSILEQSLIEDQRYILNKIIDIVKEKNVDIVLIAGDVYDKGIPNVDAIKLFNEFLNRLHDLKLKVFIISGNHDSRDRLSFGNELLALSDIYIEGKFDGNLRKVVLNDEYGEFNIYMLSFVKPADVRNYYSDYNIDSYDDMVRLIIENTDIDEEERNIVMVHQFVTANGVDVERSESESISLGGIDNVDVSNFSSFDYVAMGHIHRPQKLIKDTVRYAGSPLKYSFSEVNHKKNVPIVEFKEKGNVNVELVPLIPLRDMIVIKGSLDELLSKDYYSDIDTDSYINAIVTDDDYVMDAIGKLRSVYKNILKLEYDNKRTSVNSDISKVKYDLKKMSEIDLFKNFYYKQNNIELSDDKLKIINDVVSEVRE